MALDLPNLELIIKLLKMTTSQTDTEALVALRKANEQLAKSGADWESLLRGKVTIVEDPFKSFTIPSGYAKPTAPQPRTPPPAYDPPPSPWRPQYTAPSPKPRSSPRRPRGRVPLDSLA
jgi:hypothetical protein